MSTGFGQIVVGPPGSGKTTYCLAAHQLLSKRGRKVGIVNLDPANDDLPYTTIIDINSLIRLQDAMAHLKLGPNGGLIYCVEFLQRNTDWLQNELLKYEDHYLLFDCPGQIELFTHNTALRDVISKLEKWDYRLTCVHLVDSHYCVDPTKFIAVLMTSLNTMLRLSLPHVNVLSKADLIETFGKLHFSRDFYTDVLDLKYLLDMLSEDPFFSRYKKLNQALVDLVENYSLVSFNFLEVQNNESLALILQLADNANGYHYGPGTESGDVGGTNDEQYFDSYTKVSSRTDNKLETVTEEESV